MEISQIYDKEFFDLQARWRQEYVGMAGILATLIPFASVLDVGCGNGFLLAKLHELGKKVRGVDGSREALAAAPESIRRYLSIHDLRRPLRGRRFDLVICTEVAEHLDAAFADTLVESVCARSRGMVCFSAATPGQGGICHLNEQPHAYWVERFLSQGYEVQEALSATFRGQLSEVIHNAWWFVRNSMILQASSDQRVSQRCSNTLARHPFTVGLSGHSAASRSK